MIMQTNGTQFKVNETDQELLKKRHDARIQMEDEATRKRREEEERLEHEKKIAEEAKNEKENAEKQKEYLDKKAKEDEMIRLSKEREATAIKFKKEVEKIKSVGAQINQLRTFKSDMDELVREQSISMARVLMEEEKRRREKGDVETSDSKKKVVVISLSILLVLSGFAFGAYVFFDRQGDDVGDNANVSLPKTAESMVFSEKRNELILLKPSREEIFYAVRNAANEISGDSGKITDVQVFKGQEKQFISTRELFQSIRSEAPDELIRSLGNRFMLGAVSSFSGKNSGFLVLRSSSYQNSLAGMLRWEKGSMVKDLYEILSGFQSTIELQESPFEDRVLENQDVRILKNQNGEVVLIYGFFDTETIIISSEQDCFVEVLRRLREKPIK